MPDLALRTQWFSERAETSSEIPKKVLAYPGHHPAIEAGKLGIVVGNFFFHHPAEGRGGSQSWVQGFGGKGGVPRRVFVPSTRSPGPGLGMRQGEEQQTPPAARLRLPTPTAGQLGGRRQGQNRLSCVHPAALSPHSHFN